MSKTLKIRFYLVVFTVFLSSLWADAPKIFDSEVLTCIPDAHYFVNRHFNLLERQLDSITQLNISAATLKCSVEFRKFVPYDKDLYYATYAILDLLLAQVGISADPTIDYDALDEEHQAYYKLRLYCDSGLDMFESQSEQRRKRIFREAKDYVETVTYQATSRGIAPQILYWADICQLIERAFM